MPAYPAAVPDHYTVEVQVYRGYWMVNWFKNEFGHPEQQEATRQGVEPEVLFDKLVESYSTRCDGPGATALLEPRS